jgi:hypothetical protein
VTLFHIAMNSRVFDGWSACSSIRSSSGGMRPATEATAGNYGP